MGHNFKLLLEQSPHKYTCAHGKTQYVFDLSIHITHYDPFVADEISMLSFTPST